MTERMIEANGVELCTEPFGDPADPPILLVMGIGASMLWWEEGFCRMLADGGRFVIRYDHRDTGPIGHLRAGAPRLHAAPTWSPTPPACSTPTASPRRTSSASRPAARLAQLLALDFPERVRSLTLISTSLAVSSDRALPPPTAEFGRFVATVEVDWSDPESVIEYLVDYSRVLAGEERPFDEAAFRELARRDVERASDFAAAQNHDLLHDEEQSREPLSSISSPTLVIHGTADPMFPIGHGEALAEEIPDAAAAAARGRGPRRLPGRLGGDRRRDPRAHLMRLGLYIPPFDELADPALVARLCAEAEEAGWDGAFVWDQVRWREPVAASATRRSSSPRSPARPSASGSARWSRRSRGAARPRSRARPRPLTG